MDPRRVLTFRAVAQERSFSRAARRLALSQPSVSNQVAALEREVGVRLLQRRPGGLRLTAEGEILLEHADAIADRFGLAEAQLAGAAERLRTRLRIGALPSALAGFVPEAIARVRERHPDTQVTFDEGTSAELSRRLASGELDLAIAYQDTTWERSEPPELVRHQLLHEEFMVALPLEHRLAGGGPVALGDLRDDDWIAALTDGVIVRACRAAGFEPRLVSITHDQLAIRGLVIRGLAVTLVAEHLADPFKDLSLHPIAGMTVARDVYALLPPGRRHPLVEPTLQALDEVAAEMRVGLSRFGWGGRGQATGTGTAADARR
ncbi:MAG TPA: LysR family transcriptional regulator [Solirubrobacteraceae bacterium]|jgi:DNA-binding transcriptional LysR family regulator|nr:LysR family transcriptional regulator [Solirubrobacteraceae bacterium]